MPENPNLIPKTFPMTLRFKEKPTTEFVNNLENINVQLVTAPSMDELKHYCVPFSNGTWAEDPMHIVNYSKFQNEKDMDLAMYHVFSQKILPTTLETVRCNFLIEGITLLEVTHILRYRRAVFSAECSGDKWLTHKKFCVPQSIQNSPEFYERFQKICLDAKQLYCDMIDSEAINPQDARFIMPRNTDTFYFMSMTLKDVLMFLNDRVDKQIHPQADNVIAYQMIIELVRKYPMLVKIIGSKFIHKVAKFYVDTARQNRSTNWFRPDADSDVFEYNIKDFVYRNQYRDTMVGTGGMVQNVFMNILFKTDAELKATEKAVDAHYGEDFFKQDLPGYFGKEEY